MTRKILQANLHHSSGASAEILKKFVDDRIDIVLIQEPWVNHRIKGLNHKAAKLICNQNVSNPRAAILIRKHLNYLPLNHQTSKDLAAILVRVDGDKGQSEIVFASAYFPGDSTEDPPPGEVQSLISFCTKQDLPFIIGCDANAHHSSWGSTNINKRGESLYNYLLNEEACVLNEGDSPTFCSNGREEVLDITICSPSLVHLIHNWHVSDDPSLSDHNHIRFDYNASMSEIGKRTNPRRTDWNLFKNLVSFGAPFIPGQFSNKWELEDGAQQLGSLLLDSLKEASKPLGKTKDKLSWWTDDLTALRQKNRRLWNRAKKTNNYSDYRESLTILNNAIRKTRRNSWRSFCAGISNTTDTARVYKALKKDTLNGIGFLKTCNGSYTETRSETVELLLSTHFPDCTNISESTCHDESTDFQVSSDSFEVAQQIVTVEKTRWAINSFQPFKAPGGDEILPIMLQKGLPSLENKITHLLQASLALGYVPNSWRKVNVVFIPKPGKDADLPKSYRPISLSSFLLKTLERLVDIYIRETIDRSNPLHNLQFAYIKGKSTELAAHHLVTKIEKTLAWNQIALCAFMDIQGAFDNTGFDSISHSLRSRSINRTVHKWILSMLKDRQISSQLGGSKLTVLAAKGCPQGGVLSPLLWSLVIDDLLVELNASGIHTIGYADDIVVTIGGDAPSAIQELMDRALHRTASWCTERGLSINPAKTTIVPFHNRRELQMAPIKFLGTNLNYSEEATYLGLKLDRTLSWQPHLQWTIAKARKSLWACKNLLGKKWGLNPKMTMFIYTSMVRPIITYGSVVWWPAINSQTGINICTKMQRTASLLISGCVRSCPSIPMQAILGLAPLHLHILKVAANTAIRLRCVSNTNFCETSLHGKIISHIPQWTEITSNSDILCPRLDFVRNFEAIFPDRKSYTNPLFLSPDDPNSWYTDGSKTELGSGSGIYNVNEEISIALGYTASVFQTELHAITVCTANLIHRGTAGQRISIYSDSQAAIKAVANARCNSWTVLDCKNNLNELGRLNEVKLIWIPGHSNLAGNEEADRLANIGSASNPTEPIVKMGYFYASNIIDEWITHLERTHWHDQSGLRQSKLFINFKLHCKVLNWNRSAVRLFIGYITGHHITRAYLARIGAHHDPTCRLCEISDETTEHLLLNCPRLDSIRFSLLGKPLLRPEDIKTIPCKDLLSFIRKIEVLLHAQQ